MECINVRNDGVRSRSQVVNIGVRTRSRSLESGSKGSTKENQSGKSSSHGEKWSIGETKALLDTFEHNYIKTEKPNHGKQEWEYYAEKVNNRPKRPKNALLRDPKQCKMKMDSLRKEYQNFKNKEMKSDSSYVLWLTNLHQLDRILGTHPKPKVLEGSRDDFTPFEKAFLDLNQKVLDIKKERLKVMKAQLKILEDFLAAYLKNEKIKAKENEN